MRWQILRTIGEGGMGRVTLCLRHLGDGVRQRVVIKRPNELEASHSRLREEARALAMVHHANVVRLLDAGRDDEGPWLMLEHVDGADVAALIEHHTHGPKLSPDESAWILHEAARGVSALHRARTPDGALADLVHRDLSPQNLLLSRDAEVKITDFGIAWATERESRTATGTVVGNLRYIAPEQLEGRVAGPRTDLYGLGRVLEELLTVTDSPPDSLRAIAARATQRAPDQRYDTADAMLDALLDAVPTLCRGRASLAERVTSLCVARASLQGAFAAMLSSGDAPNETLPREITPAPVELPIAPAPAPAASRPRPRRAVGWVIAAVGVVTVGLSLRKPAAHTASRALARPTPQATPEPVAIATTPAPTVIEAVPRAHAVVAEPDAGRVAALRPRELHRTDPARPTRADAGGETETAALLVSSLPYALVTIDDRPAVGTPFRAALGAGRHRVRARFASGVERETTLELRAGEVRPLGFTDR